MGKHKKKSKKSTKRRTHSESSDEWEEAPLETATETLQASRSKAHTKMRKPIDDDHDHGDDDDDEKQLRSSRQQGKEMFRSGRSDRSRNMTRPSWRKHDPDQERDRIAAREQITAPTLETVVDFDHRRDVSAARDHQSELIAAEAAEPLCQIRQSTEQRYPVASETRSTIDAVTNTATRERASTAEAGPKYAKDKSLGQQGCFSSSKKTDETAELLTSDKMNKLSAKILKAELKGDMDTAQRLKVKLDSAIAARSALDQHPDQQETVVIITKDKPNSSNESSKRNRNKADKRAENKKLRLEGDWHFLENKFVRRKVEEDEATNSSLQRAKRLIESASNPTGNDDDDDGDGDGDNGDDELGDVSSKREVRTKSVVTNAVRERSVTTCEFCVDSAVCGKHLIIHEGENASLMLPRLESLTEFHCCIVPKTHLAALTLADDDTWSEIKKFRQTLTRMFAAEDMDCVFLQTVTSLSGRSHASIQCVPVPNETAEMIPMYFKKAIEECETEWTMNKKLVRLSKEGVRSSIPKGLPYFAVDFGEQNGFGHVIEDRTRFPDYFGLEIIGNILDVSPSVWLRPRKETFSDQSRKVLNFERLWCKHGCSKLFDCND